MYEIKKRVVKEVIGHLVRILVSSYKDHLLHSFPLLTKFYPNQKLSPTSCITIARYRGTSQKITHEYTMIFSYKFSCDLCERMLLL